MAKPKFETDIPTPSFPLIEAFGVETITITARPSRLPKRPKARCKGRFTRRLQKQMDEAHAINALGTLARIVS